MSPRHASAVLVSPRTLPPIASVVLGFGGQVLRWQNRRASRRALSQLDAHMLRDIGVGSEVAMKEAGKPFWRV